MCATTFEQLLTVKEACKRASLFLDRAVSETNICYLIQYGKVKKYGENGNIQIEINFPCFFSTIQHLKTIYIPEKMMNFLMHKSNGEVIAR